MAESAVTIEQLAENHQITRWACNTFAAQKRWDMCDVNSWHPENIRVWAEEVGPDRVAALYEHCDNVSVAEFEALLDLAAGIEQI